jgi:putative ABC transport system ATP-binding protein
MIEVNNLHKVYGQGDNSVFALRGINLQVKAGEFVAVMGRSGSGKSTLLHMLGLLDKATSGDVVLDGKRVLELSEEQKAGFRLSRLGYVFQEFSLVSELTILENVYLPGLCLSRRNNWKDTAIQMLKTVGLEKRMKHYPHQVSGGEQQRTAIARAMINCPKILFADEPTASLDGASAKTVLELFRKVNRELGLTIVMVTHEPEDKMYVDRVVWLKDGLIVNNDEGDNLGPSSRTLSG